MLRTHIPVGWIIAAALFPATVFAQTSKPTFGKDIAPIFYAKCAMCHRPGEVAPMSLMSYDEVRPWARAIKNKVVARQMPPWYAEGEHGKWRNDRRLSQAEIDKIVAWADAGAPRGNDSDLPAPPPLAQGWNRSEWDATRSDHRSARDESASRGRESLAVCICEAAVPG